MYLGLDLSTQQLKAIIIDSNLKTKYEAKVDFDADFPQYATIKGVLFTPNKEGEIYSPVRMWLEAIDLVLDRLKQQELDFSTIKAISGAAIQHATVFWSSSASVELKSMDPSKPLGIQLGSSFTSPRSPNWQDSSTDEQCTVFDSALGDLSSLASITGSKAHHRFSGPQILKFAQENPENYKQTERISLASSFLASIFLGAIAPIDVADAGGTNLFDIKSLKWHPKLLAITGDPAHILEQKLGKVHTETFVTIGSISSYFIQRYGFDSSCKLSAFTGDNPATLLSLPLARSDGIVSLGTSTTLLMSTNIYAPDPDYHVMPHPTVEGAYMVMLCYKNGALAREKAKDALPLATWENFDETVVKQPPLGKQDPTDDMRIGIYFPLPEILPSLPTTNIRALYNANPPKLAIFNDSYNEKDPRTILESQFLSIRLRSRNLLSSSERPHKLYLVGGGSVSPSIALVCGQVLSPTEGVLRVKEGLGSGNACAVGAARRAAWVGEGAGLGWEQWISAKETEEEFETVYQKHDKDLWEQYGAAANGLHDLEQAVENQPKPQR